MEIAIGEAARRCGVKAPTIRFYEQIGLLPAPDRTAGNRRFFSEGDLARLAFIRHARELGFDIEAIRALLALADQPDQPCEKVDQIARAHLAEIDSRIRRLVALRGELQRMTDQGAHGRVADCRVIEVLADHSHCSTQAH